MSKTNAELTEFWGTIERSIGESVTAYGLGRYVSGKPDTPGPLWGLLYASPSALFFHHFPQENWFSSMVKTSRSGARDVRAEEVKIRIAFSEVQRFNRPLSSRSWWRTLVAGEAVYELVGRDGVAFRFSIENQRNKLVAAIEAGLAGVALPSE